VVEEDKEKRVIDGRTYLLEYPLTADFALIKAHQADRWGNLTYRRTSRTFNATMAGAAKVTIAEVDELVELGDLDPECVVTPMAYVDRIVVRPKDLAVEDKPISEQALESHRRFQERGSA